jgi:N-methylhydantoinase A
MPGPACYEAGGTEATVTDAHLTLGRLPDALAGGALKLSRAAASVALTRLAENRGLDRRRVACGIIEIATQQLCSAVRRMLALAGLEASAFALMAMGGRRDCTPRIWPPCEGLIG